VKGLRDLTTGARDAVSCSRGVPHFYALWPGAGAREQCAIGEANCSTQTVYHEQLTHPVLPYVDRNVPIYEGEYGYAELGYSILGSLDDGGPIVFHVDKSRLWHQNHTREDHRFHPGHVNRQTVVENGKIYITTVGEGTGDCKTFNEIVGVTAFKMIDKKIRKHVQSGRTATHAPIP
jgi:hypothetical protein